MRLIIKDGSIVDYEYTHLILNFISRDCRMNTPLNNHIFSRYSGLKDYTLNQIKVQRYAKRCICTRVKKSSKWDSNILIAHLITKEKYFERISDNDLKLALIDLRFIVEYYNIKRMVIPRIMTSLDNATWNRFNNYIKSIFDKTDIEIRVI